MVESNTLGVTVAAGLEMYHSGLLLDDDDDDMMMMIRSSTRQMSRSQCCVLPKIAQTVKQIISSKSADRRLHHFDVALDLPSNAFSDDRRV